MTGGRARRAACRRQRAGSWRRSAHAEGQRVQAARRQGTTVHKTRFSGRGAPNSSRASVAGVGAGLRGGRRRPCRRAAWRRARRVRQSCSSLHLVVTAASRARAVSRRAKRRDRVRASPSVLEVARDGAALRSAGARRRGGRAGRRGRARLAPRVIGAWPRARAGRGVRAARRVHGRRVVAARGVPRGQARVSVRSCGCVFRVARRGISVRRAGRPVAALGFAEVVATVCHSWRRR